MCAKEFQGVGPKRHSGGKGKDGRRECRAEGRVGELTVDDYLTLRLDKAYCSETRQGKARRGMASQLPPPSSAC